MAGRALLGEGVLVGQVARLEHDDDERAEGARRHRGLNGEDNWARRWAMWGTARASGSAHDGLQLEVAVHELLVLLPHRVLSESLPTLFPLSIDMVDTVCATIEAILSTK
jgi:hypothetical protein